MKDEIYELIPTDRFITRKELKELTGYSDRHIRDAISEIKKEHTIISLSSLKGYKRVKSSADMTNEEKLKEMELIKHCINEINCKKKVYNHQLRQFIANLKVLEKSVDK